MPDAARRSWTFRSSSCTRTALAAVLGLLWPVGAAIAQEVTSPALKAVYVYNFAKFTTWPPDALPPDAPLTMCVLGDSAVGDALARTVRGRLVFGREMRVSEVTTAAPLAECQILYISGLSAERAAAVVDNVGSAPVLTVSDISGFTGAGGIALFYFHQGNLRYYVDVAASRRAQLQISSRLLALSRRP